jgi:hypothetical protein
MLWVSITISLRKNENIYCKNNTKVSHLQLFELHEWNSISAHKWASVEPHGFLLLFSSM